MKTGSPPIQPQSAGERGEEVVRSPTRPAWKDCNSNWIPQCHFTIPHRDLFSPSRDWSISKSLFTPTSPLSPHLGVANPPLVLILHLDCNDFPPRNCHCHKRSLRIGKKVALIPLFRVLRHASDPLPPRTRNRISHHRQGFGPPPRSHTGHETDLRTPHPISRRRGQETGGRARKRDRPNDW